MNRHTSWELTQFHPISFCNTYGLHLIRNGDFNQIMVLDINGTAHCHWKSQKKTINLKEFFEEERNYADFDLELVASDSYLLDKHDGNSSSEILFLATCWIVYDKLFAPKRHFSALYRITIESLETELAAKFDLQNVPTYTRISATPPTNVNGKERKLYWLIFAYSEGSCGFSIETESNRVEPVERIGDIFPFLDIRDFPGSAIRSHCRVIGSHRLSLVSYDTGYVIASVCLMQSGIIIDRKSLKFDGPISVLKVIDTKVEEEGVKLISILISSTIGPVTVWELRLQDDMLSWELASVLLETEHYDTVITAAVHRGLIFVGTYAELLLIYELKEVLQNRADEVAPVQTVNIASPILAISSLDNQQLVVLSNKGLHRLKPSIPLDSPLDAMQNSY